MNEENFERKYGDAVLSLIGLKNTLEMFDCAIHWITLTPILDEDKKEFDKLRDDLTKKILFVLEGLDKKTPKGNKLTLNDIKAVKEAEEEIAKIGREYIKTVELAMRLIGENRRVIWESIKSKVKEGAKEGAKEAINENKIAHDISFLASRARKETKNRKEAGKKAFKETRKTAVDKARADKEYAFKLCREIIKENNMSYKGESFYKADAVFDYVIDHFYEIKTKGELTGYLRSSNGARFKASSFRREYYEYYKGKE